MMPGEWTSGVMDTRTVQDRQESPYDSLQRAGSTSEYPWKSWRKFLGLGKSVHHCLGCCLHDQVLDKWKKIRDILHLI